MNPPSGLPVGLLNEHDNLSNILAYHERSKHRLDRYAAGPSGLDWDDQPEPFRWFSGAPRIELPFTADSVATPYSLLSTASAVAPRPLDLDGLSALLERSLGLAAWKQYGPDRWALRCNPSSGNLHPTEAYVVTDGLPGLSAGVFHYLSRDHVLEQRCAPGAGVLSARLPAQTLLIGLSSIHWREAWKYGERAYRYCQLDAGHAIAALRYAAAALGWSLRQLDAWGDADIARMLGLAREQDFEAAEREVPDVLLLVQADGTAPEPSPDDLNDALRTAPWQGRANCLSKGHFERWPVIDEVSEACSKPRSAPVAVPMAALPEPLDSACEEPAMELFRRRRSAQRFDAATAISAAQFFRMLDMLLPRDGVAPWDSLPGEPRIHPVFFIHRVEGLRPGLYVMPRRSGAEAVLRGGLRREAFAWQPVEGCPAHLPLSSLVLANSRRVAATLSCHQAIAADSAFAVAMLAEFDSTLARAPWDYRQLYREAGMLGQVLYLEAEAAGVQGTGIGCFFDDPLHELLGIGDRCLQSLYHFTVGGAVIDHRLTTLPPYAVRSPSPQNDDT